jgi:hypothetical protein
MEATENMVVFSSGGDSRGRRLESESLAGVHQRAALQHALI